MSRKRQQRKSSKRKQQRSSSSASVPIAQSAAQSGAQSVASASDAPPATSPVGTEPTPAREPEALTTAADDAAPVSEPIATPLAFWTSRVQAAGEAALEGASPVEEDASGPAGTAADDVESLFFDAQPDPFRFAEPAEAVLWQPEPEPVPATFSPEACERRVRFGRYVRGVVGAAAALCLLAVAKASLVKAQGDDADRAAATSQGDGVREAAPELQADDGTLANTIARGELAVAAHPDDARAWLTLGRAYDRAYELRGKTADAARAQQCYIACAAAPGGSVAAPADAETVARCRGLLRPEL